MDSSSQCCTQRASKADSQCPSYARTLMFCITTPKRFKALFTHRGRMGGKAQVSGCFNSAQLYSLLGA